MRFPSPWQSCAMPSHNTIVLYAKFMKSGSGVVSYGVFKSLPWLEMIPKGSAHNYWKTVDGY